MRSSEQRSAPPARTASVACASRRPTKPEPAAHADRGRDLGRAGLGRKFVEDVERDRARRAQREALGVGRDHVDVETSHACPASRPTTRARLPATRRSPSRPSKLKSIGAHRPQAVGSVNTSRTSSARPDTVVCAVQVLMASTLVAPGVWVVVPPGDLHNAARPICLRSGRPSQTTPPSSLRTMRVAGRGATFAPCARFPRPYRRTKPLAADPAGPPGPADGRRPGHGRPFEAWLATCPGAAWRPRWRGLHLRRGRAAPPQPGRRGRGGRRGGAAPAGARRLRAQHQLRNGLLGRDRRVLARRLCRGPSPVRRHRDSVLAFAAGALLFSESGQRRARATRSSGSSWARAAGLRRDCDAQPAATGERAAPRSQQLVAEREGRPAAP